MGKQLARQPSLGWLTLKENPSPPPKKKRGKKGTTGQLGTGYELQGLLGPHMQQHMSKRQNLRLLWAISNGKLLILGFHNIVSEDV